MTCKGLTIDASISPHKSMIENLNENLSQTSPSRDAWLEDGEHFLVTLFCGEPVTH